MSYKKRLQYTKVSFPNPHKQLVVRLLSPVLDQLIEQGWSYHPAFFDTPDCLCLSFESPTEKCLEYILMLDFKFVNRSLSLLISLLLFRNDRDKNEVFETQEIHIEIGKKPNFNELRLLLLRLVNNLPDKDLISF